MKKDLSEMTLEELWQLFPIILRKHNPEYREWYLREEENIKKAVGRNEVRRINHIGSTAVEDLLAKPTVDILLEVDDNCDIENMKEKLKKAGWTLTSDLEKVADYITFIHEGKILLSAPKNELINEYGILHCKHSQFRNMGYCFCNDGSNVHSYYNHF